MAKQKENEEKYHQLKEHCKKIFDYYDKDKSGFLERNELRRYLTDRSTGMGLPDNDIDTNLFELYIINCDDNSDGKISFEEFMNHLSCFYT